MITSKRGQPKEVLPEKQETEPEKEVSSDEEVLRKTTNSVPVDINYIQMEDC